MEISSIRGATTAEKNNREDILQATRELLGKILDSNKLEIDDITSILFTCTKDLTAVYPAVAARDLNITQAALMCMQEMYVEGSLPMCIRVMLTCQCDKKQSEVRHIYLREAKKLRPDIVMEAED